MKKPWSRNEVRVSQTITYAIGLATGFGLATSWWTVLLGVMIYAIVMLLFAMAE